MKDFKKSDLKNRMVVETRGQHLFLVVDNCLLGYGEWNRLSMFDENLMFKGGLIQRVLCTFVLLVEGVVII